MRNIILTTSVLVAAGSLAAQGTFYPIPDSAPITSSNENTAPFLVPTGVTQTKITDRNTLMAQGLPATANNWDMVAFSPDSRFIFVPCENFGAGGGIFRYDTLTGDWIEIFIGNAAGAANRQSDPNTFDHTTDETVANDPCTWTPWGSIIFGEETTGGRFFECTNPLDPTGPFHVIWHDSIPSVRHEGMRIDSEGTLYYIDESNTGSIYKFVPTTYGDLSSGQSFVLSVDGYANDPNANPAENFNSAANQLTTREGMATWVPLTDVNNQPLTPTNPFTYVTVTAGQIAADEVFGTPFGRPEDLDIGFLANGNECVYVALTSENRVLSIELISSTTCMVRDFCNYDTINLATGTDVNPTQQDPFTSPGPDTETNFDDPDNLTIGPDGAIYILEDETPGDIWKAVDADGDGVAEHLAIFASLATTGSEPTGLIFDPNNPYRAICNIQHPASGNDALWAFETRPYPGADLDLTLETGVDATPSKGPGEFVRNPQAFQSVSVRVDSPTGTLYGQPFAAMFQLFDTAAGQSTFLPPLWLNPFAPSFPLIGGFTGGFPYALPFGGGAVAVIVPPGLSGLSVMVQGIGVDATGALILTDGVELQF